MASKKTQLVPANQIEAAARDRIVEVRGERVVLDSDLAEFYGVRTDRLTQAVQRNQNRFPKDFCFRLTAAEFKNLTPQNAGSSWGGRRRPPMVLTEQGALAVSGILKSDRAAEVSVAVSRAFVAMRDQLAAIDEHPAVKELLKRMGTLEAGSKKQEEFNRVVKECLAELRPILDAVKDEAADPDLPS